MILHDPIAVYKSISQLTVAPFSTNTIGAPLSTVVATRSATVHKSAVSVIDLVKVPLIVAPSVFLSYSRKPDNASSFASVTIGNYSVSR